MNPRKQDWDTRAWLAGIIGGAVGGSITVWATYPPFQTRLNALPHLSFIGKHSADVISGIAGVLSLLLLPGLVSGLARRRTFLWGLLPLTLFLVAVDVEDWIESGSKDVISSFWVSLAVIGICWLVSSGPVSLFRWQRVRVKRREAALAASYQATREAASIPQEGVWPPPPDYTA